MLTISRSCKERGTSHRVIGAFMLMSVPASLLAPFGAAHSAVIFLSTEQGVSATSHAYDDVTSSTVSDVDSRLSNDFSVFNESISTSARGYLNTLSGPILFSRADAAASQNVVFGATSVTAAGSLGADSGGQGSDADTDLSLLLTFELTTSHYLSYDGYLFGDAPSFSSSSLEANTVGWFRLTGASGELFNHELKRGTAFDTPPPGVDPATGSYPFWQTDYFVSMTDSVLLQAGIYTLELGAYSYSVVSGATNFSYDLAVNVESVVVPVPAAVWLFGSGLLGLVSLVKRREFS